MCFRTKVSLLLLALFIGAGVFSMNVAPAEAASLAELQQIIEQLKIQIAELQDRLTAIEQGKEDPVEWCHDFNKNLKYGDKGAEVIALQTAMKKQGFTKVSKDKPGIFGMYTASAIVEFQKKYRKEILDPLGLKYGTGFVGKLTRAKLNKLYGCEQKPEPEPEPSITIISPNGGEEWAIGSTHTIRWTSDTESSRVVIDILDKQGKCADTEDGLPAVVANNEAIEWAIPTNFSSGQYKMRVMICPVSMPSQECANIDLKQYGFDESDNYFSIVSAGTQTCTDTDKGIAKYVKGTACKTLVVAGEDTMFCRTDRCIPLPDSYTGTDIQGYLTEYYCEDSKIFSKTIHCENGCVNGACKQQEQEQCAKEGESVPVVPGAMECCEGLIKISCAKPDISGSCPEGCVGASICANCGNGICGLGENKCNCPKDCGDCHTSDLWSWDYCSPGCKCSAGEGDCDADIDCATGYCVKNVGANYGQDSKIDVCEEKQGQ